MDRHQKQGKGRRDEYYFLAKESGYRSRAAFKLLQLDKKFNFLDGAHCLVDLCAAPGGWSQVAAASMPVGSMVIAIDLVPIKPLPGVKTFQADITTQRCRNLLRAELTGWAVDVVVHDGAPNMGTNWDADAYMQSVLVLWAAKLACEFLRPGGVFVSKIFRSGDYMALLYVLNQLFEKVDVTKPKSSRERSAEVFAVCQGFRAPAQLDDRLFEPDYVFRNYAGEAKATARENVYGEAYGQARSLKQLSKDLSYSTRHRGGYEDGNDTLYRGIPVLEFVTSSRPVSVLASHSEILFCPDVRTDPRTRRRYLRADIKAGTVAEAAEGSLTDPSLSFHGRTVSSWEEYFRLQEAIFNDPLTTDEIRALCADLKVLSKSEFKRLVSWREKMLKKLCDMTVAAVAESADQDELVEGTTETQANAAARMAATPPVSDVVSDAVSDSVAAATSAAAVSAAEEQEREIQAKRLAERRKRERAEMRRSLKAIRRFGQYDEEAIQQQGDSVAGDRLFSLSGLQKAVEMQRAREDSSSVSSGDEEADAKAGVVTGSPGAMAAASQKTSQKTQELLHALDEADDAMRRNVAAGLPEDYDSSLDEADAALDFDEASDEREAYLKKVEENLDAYYNVYLRKQREQARKRREMESLERRARGQFYDEDELRREILQARSTDEPVASSLEAKWFSHPAFSKSVRDRGGRGDGDENVKNEGENDENDENDEFYDMFAPLPKENLIRTERHRKRVKELAIRARKLQKQVQADAKALGEHAGGMRDIDIVRDQGSAEEEQGRRDAMLQQGEALDLEVGAPSSVAGRVLLGQGIGQGALPRDSVRQLDLSDGSLTDSSSEEGGEVIEEPSSSSSAGDSPADQTDQPVPLHPRTELLLKDTHNQAVAMALAKKMLRRKGQEEIQNASYNKYTFYNDEDPATLPKWFREEEERHSQVELPLTKAEVAQMRAKITELSSRPIKKVEEALARKKMRAYAHSKALASKADSLANRADITEFEKVRMMEKAAAAARRQARKPKKRVIIGNLNKARAAKSAGKVGHKFKFVDRRMKKDERNEKARLRRGGKARRR